MILAAWTLLACDPTGGVSDRVEDEPEDTAGNVEDNTPPVVVFEPLSTNQPSGQDVVIDATITDEGSGVFAATLYYRNETDSSKDWRTIGFVSTGSDTWRATITADKQHSSGMWYYILARDGSQNEAYAPEDGEDDPYHFGYTD